MALIPPPGCFNHGLEIDRKPFIYYLFKRLKNMIQTSKQKTWLDEAGMEIPVSRVTSEEKQRERAAAKLLADAKKINNALQEFKNSVSETCAAVYDTYMASRKVTAPMKGNFTWYNFDRSIKIEVSVNERIEFDDMSLAACRAKLNEFLEGAIDSKVEFIKDLVNEAFSTSRGRLDSKKVMSLLKYKSKIKEPAFAEAMDYLEQSIRRSTSRTYFRVWEKVGGEYQAVDLNFSSI